MVDLSAKWGNILYEEALREVANVSLPETTMEEIMTTDIQTPGVSTTTTSYSIPSVIKPTVIETLYNVATTATDVLIGTREEKVVAVSSLIPADITTETTTAPDYNADISTKAIDIENLGAVDIPTIEYPESVITTDSGLVENITAADITTNISTVDFDKYIQEMIDIQKDTIEGAKEFWEQGVLGTSDIEVTMPSITFPEIDLLGGLKDVGKWILIAGGVLAGVYLLGKVLGGKK